MSVKIKRKGNGLRLKIKESEGKARVLAGVLSGSTRKDDRTGKTLSVAQYAAYNEFGAAEKGLPARPFLQNTMRDHYKEWKRTIAEGIQALGFKEVEKVLIRVGEMMRGDIRDQIRNGDFEKLAEQTIKAKKRRGAAEPDTPLIDTGALMNSIQYEVELK